MAVRTPNKKASRSLKRPTKDLLTVASIPSGHIARLIKEAKVLKKKRRSGRPYRPLIGKTLGLIFEKPSTRTRVSFQAGMNQMGGEVAISCG